MRRLEHLACLGLAALLALSLAGLSAACNRVTSERVEASGSRDPATRVRDHDRQVAAELSAGRHAEARGWLRRDRNRLFAGDPKRVDALVEDLHAEGADDVWFTGIEDFGGARVTATLIVALPDDAAKRAALLRREARFLERSQPADDLGQRYLAFRF